MFQQQAFQSELEKSGKEEGELPFRSDPHLEQNQWQKSQWFMGDTFFYFNRWQFVLMHIMKKYMSYNNPM